MDKKTIIYFCLFGFFIRVVYVLFFNHELTFPDEERFWEEGLSLVNSFSFQASDKYAHDMPLTGLSIAAFSVLTGGSVVGVKLCFALISSSTIYLISSLSHEIYPSRYTAILAAAISSVYPFFIYYSSLLLSETLFLFVVTLLFLLLLRIKKSRYYLVGVIAGLVHLTRPTLLYFMPVIWIWQYLIAKLSAKVVGIGIILFVVIISLWGIRNTITLGQFHLTTSGSGQVLWEGNNPWNKTGGVSGGFSDTKAYLDDLPEGLSELETDSWKKENAIQYILEEPTIFMDRSIKKFLRFWHLWPNSPEHQSFKYKIISLLSFGVVLFFAIMSIFLLRGEFKKLLLIYAFISYYTLIHMVTIGSIRYRLPLEPVLIALASASVVKLIIIYNERVRNKAR